MFKWWIDKIWCKCFNYHEFKLNGYLYTKLLAHSHTHFKKITLEKCLHYETTCIKKHYVEKLFD
jgi:hypothetical protein